jgi:glycosyltransferase involved in cell wall biosynthesis
MNILVSSHVFYPSIGGLEAVSLILAREFARAGHRVTMITKTLGIVEEDKKFSFNVVRRPAPWTLWQHVMDADVVFHNHISIQMAWPLLFIQRPWVVTHGIWIPRSGFGGIKGAVKRFVLQWAKGVAISEAVAADFDSPSVVIRNPYDAETFHEIPGMQRNKELVFVGRFVSDKGLPVLLRAMAQLGKQGLWPSLTVVGGGPEEAVCRRLSGDLGQYSQVNFIGVKRGRELAEVLNAHKVLVVPSLWNEPFGVVALEGMACGCMVVGSEGGGLKEAIGPGGLTFPNGDIEALAASLKKALYDAETIANCRSAVPAHLAQHQPGTVAGRYLKVFSNVLMRGRHAGSC